MTDSASTETGEPIVVPTRSKVGLWLGPIVFLFMLLFVDLVQRVLCTLPCWSSSSSHRFHAFFQFYVNDGRLSCQLYQRSADAFLGVPFNISSYSLLTCMMAQVCGLEPGEFVWTGGDCHLYLNHLDQAREQISREPLELPRLRLDPSVMDIDGFTGEHIAIEGYEHHPHIVAPISV